MLTHTEKADLAANGIFVDRKVSHNCEYCGKLCDGQLQHRGFIACDGCKKAGLQAMRNETRGIHECRVRTFRLTGRKYMGGNHGNHSRTKKGEAPLSRQ